MRRLVVAGSLIAAGLLGPARAGAAPDDACPPLPDVPAYAAPAMSAELPPPLAAAADEAIRALVAAAPQDAVDPAIRRLSAIGKGALPRIAAALARAPWRTRTSLVWAVAEMDAPEATDLLAAASRDPSFAVREAAVVGLGKTGAASGASAAAARARSDSEPAWRVRAAAAAALRRCVLRGVGDAAAAHAAMLVLLDDPDDDVRRAALENAAPLAIPAALPGLLAAYADTTRTFRERSLALAALRTYRTPDPLLLEKLRTGFTTSEDTAEAVRAGTALLDIRGAAALEDRDVSDAVLRHLLDEGSADVRDALGRLGREAAPWLAARVKDLAHRIATRRVDHGATPFDQVLDALVQVDEAAGIAALRDLLAGPDAGTLDRETRLTALRRAEISFAAQLGPEVRGLWASPAGRDVLPDVLRAIAASGGDDAPRFVADALRHAASEVRTAALDVLNAHPALPTPPELRALAESAPGASERRRALTSLARRDAAAAAAIAERLLAHEEPAMRETAADLLAASPRPEQFSKLAERLAREDGSAPEPPPESVGRKPVEGPVTADDGEPPKVRARRTVRLALVSALRVTGGEQARPLLLALLGDDDARIRESAARALLGLAGPRDAPALLARLDAEPNEGVREHLLRLIATLDGSAEARARFAALLADANGRPAALRLLSEPFARVVPEGLDTALADPTYNDEERVSVLRILERGRRAPPAAELAAMVRASTSHEVAGEALRLLVTSSEPAAESELILLADESPDAVRLALVVQAIGERRSARGLAAVLRIFESSHAPALAARSRVVPVFQLHRACATALGRIRGDRAGEALVEHLLDPRLSAAAGRASVLADGPFQPREGTVVSLVRTLVASFASFDEQDCVRLLDAALARRAPGASDRTLDEGTLDGIARYLHDPGAYDLPPRRRTAAAARLWDLVARTAPRSSQLDAHALERVGSELQDAGRLAEAAASFRASLAVEDVENAARSAEERKLEQARLRAMDARAAAAAGRTEEALAVAQTIRDPDPTSGDLAYRQGWLLVKLGKAGPEAEAALRFAAGRSQRDVAPRFLTGWVVERTQGPEKALPLYLEAVRLDGKLTEEGGGEIATDRRGHRHRWGDYLYFAARARALAGRPDGQPDGEVAALLRDAVSLDDRFAGLAAKEPAFAKFDDLPAFLAQCLDAIPAAPQR